MNKMFDLLIQLLFALAGTGTMIYAALQTYRQFGVPMWIVGVAEATVLGLGAWVAFTAQEWVYMAVFAFFALTELAQGALFSWEERRMFADI